MINFLGILGLIFITLKLMGYIAWSWWIVLAPLYAIPLLLLAVATFLGVMVIMNEGLKSSKKK